MFESKTACLGEELLWAEKATENRNLTDHEDIEKALKMAEYIKNGMWQLGTSASTISEIMSAETLALYSLRKYRHLKNHYYPNS